MLYEKVAFPEALEILARKWGVAVPRSNARHDGDPARGLGDLNGAAADFFRETLKNPNAGKRGREYLLRRGLEEPVIEKLGIGYAPDSWEALRSHLVGKLFTPEEMLKAGLVVPRKEGTGQYDRFRDRVVFPIRDVTGRTIAFGGRTTGDAEPKYMNSPETPLYVKGEHLYGLDLARQAIRREGYAIVVEGYLDAAALLQGGFENTVATLGTAFTPAQARLLHRHTDRVIVSYDGDAAGSSATVRSLDLLLEEGMDVRVADLPAGLDPDDLIRQQGASVYDRLLRQAPGYLQFLLLRETRTRDLSRVEEKVAAVNNLLPHIARLSSPVARASWAGQLAGTLGVEDELILQELRAALKGGRSAIRQRPAAAQSVREAEARLVSLLLRGPESRARARETLDPADLEGTRVGLILKSLLDVDAAGGEVDYPRVIAELEREEDRELLTRIAFREEPEGTADEVDRCLDVLRRGRLRREGRDLQREIEQQPSATVDELLETKLRLARQIDALS
jgi:DNA primase